MGFQKTFQLARKAKGAHLVTKEVVDALGDNLRNVQVRLVFLCFFFVFSFFITNADIYL